MEVERWRGGDSVRDRVGSVIHHWLDRYMLVSQARPSANCFWYAWGRKGLVTLSGLLCVHGVHLMK